MNHAPSGAQAGHNVVTACGRHGTFGRVGGTWETGGHAADEVADPARETKFSVVMFGPKITSRGSQPRNLAALCSASSRIFPTRMLVA